MKNFYIIVKLAWRNIWRSKRRTLLTLLTIIMGCAMIILINSFAKGGHDAMIEDAILMNTGHIQIHEKGFWDNMTIDYAFQISDQLNSELENNIYITGYSSRILAGGLLSFSDTTRGILAQGIDPVKEKKVSDFHKRIISGGRFLKESDSNHAIIGQVLAKNIGAKTGDKISILSQGFDGSIAADRFEVVGIFKSNVPEIDRELIIIPVSQAVSMFSMLDFYHSTIIRIDDLSNLAKVKKSLLEITEKDGQSIEVMSWEELMPELVQFIIMDDISGYIFDCILFIVVAFGVLNTIQMSVFERTREFGVMLSIGTKPGQITRMILAETIGISLIGIMLGVLLGVGTAYYFEMNPIDFSDYSKEAAVWGMNTTLLPANATLLNISMTSIITFLLAILFSIFPARRAAGLNPIEAIRKL